MIHGDSAPQKTAAIDEIKGTYRDLEKDEGAGAGASGTGKVLCLYVCGGNRTGADGGPDDLLSAWRRRSFGIFTQEYSVKELEEWFFGLLEEYRKWADFGFEWQQIRTASIKALAFPYAYQGGTEGAGRICVPQHRAKAEAVY